jgi:hypothetical protein
MTEETMSAIKRMYRQNGVRPERGSHGQGIEASI